MEALDLMTWKLAGGEWITIRTANDLPTRTLCLKNHDRRLEMSLPK